ncbi:MAG: hypothetical protein GWP91_16615 [Rhodobacterales bacterium]|nr:hypothetical protein [Rhodobacterales bacterium]
MHKPQNDTPNLATVQPDQRHTVAQLSIASAAAVLITAVLLAIAVLPAELGVDPTGLGTQLGLTQMGLMKQAPITEVPQEVPFVQQTTTQRLTLLPNQGAEIKAVMRAGDAMEFEWAADNGPLFFEFHGDPKGRPASEFTSYEKGTKQGSDGTFEATFDGKHGWYWKNKSAQTVTVTLTTSGVYQSVTKQ